MRKKILLVLGLLVSLFFLGGCAWFGWLAPEPELPPPQIEIEEVVSEKISAAEGGTITVTEEMSPVLAGLVFDVPPGALMADTVITVGKIGYGLSPLPDGYVPIGPPISLGPTGLIFQNPVTLRIPFPEDMYVGGIAAPEDILLKRYDRELNRWLRVPVQYIEDDMIVAEITKFSRYWWARAWERLEFWERPNPASPWAIADQARYWWRVSGRGDRSYRERLNVRRGGVQFSYKIGYLLLAEAMWEKVSRGYLHEGTNLARIVAGAIVVGVGKDEVLKALGLKALAPVAAVVGMIQLTPKVGDLVFGRLINPERFNNQLIAYLSWRGWFFECGGGGGWRRPRNPGTWTFNPARSRSHERAMGKRTFWRPRNYRESWWFEHR